MKGHVPTPPDLAEKMVRGLFRDSPPDGDDRILYPGSGTGPFAAAVERICDEEGWSLPEGVGIESNPEHVATARDRDLDHVAFRERDYLGDEVTEAASYDYIVGNPPYVPIEGLSDGEKEQYKSAFQTAVGRFDLYLLFFERSLELLAPGGRLSFVTPEKYEYVDTARPLRKLLTADGVHVECVEHLPEDAFTDLITFPCVTSVHRTEASTESKTRVILRDGSTHEVELPSDGSSWASHVRGADLENLETGVTFADVTKRISPGMATGADEIFVFKRDTVPDAVDSQWIRPTVSGSQLSDDGPYADSVFVCPYTDDGELADESELGTTLDWLRDHRERLENRSCVEGGKAWYAWHETPPLDDILQPKVVWRDIDDDPTFWAEERADVVPKHSVYYAVPDREVSISELVEYLNSPEARMWLEANCQRAHNGYYRLQSRVLSDLPVPRECAATYQATL